MIGRHLSAVAACLLFAGGLAGCGRDGLALGSRPGVDAALDDGGDDGGLSDGPVGADTGFPDATLTDTGFPPPPDTGVDSGFPPPPDTGVDSGFPPPPDAGFPDATVPDTGVDSGFPPPPDSGVDSGFPPPPDSGVDAGFPDATMPDTGPTDGAIDAGPTDGTVPDVGPPDGGGPDASVPDLGTPDSGVPCPMTCSFLDTPCAVGVCAPDGMTCVQAPRPPGTLCDDGDLCTVGDRCRAGTCLSGRPLDCSGAGDACNAGVCDPTAGGCVATPVPDGLPCDDGDACTLGFCTGGACLGTPNPPPGDTCADPIPVLLTPGTLIETGNNECAVDDGTGSCTFGSLGRDLIYQLQPLNATRRLVATTVAPASGSSFDTVLHVQTTCAMPTTELVCDDDSGAVFFSRFDTVLPRTQDSFLFMDAFSSGAVGDYQLELEVDPQDTCANPSILPFPAIGQSIVVAGNTTGANNTFTANCASRANSPDHVYELVVPTQASLRLETLSPGAGQYDTALHVRSSTCAAGDVGVIACDDDAGQGTLSRIDQTFAPGTYYVVVDGFASNSQGEYLLQITQSPPLEVFIFPEVSDARQPLSGPFSTAGQFVEGIRNSSINSVARVQVNLQVTNALTCGVARFSVRINNVNVGSFFVRPGDAAVNSNFNLVNGVSGGRYNIRYELTQDVQPMCGSVTLPDGVSTVGLGN